MHDRSNPLAVAVLLTLVSDPALACSRQVPRSIERRANEGHDASTAPSVRWGPWEPPIEVATGEAYAGPWQMNDSDFRYVDDPSVAVREDHAVAVVWADNARRDVLFQCYDRQGRAQLGEPTNVSRSPHIFSWLPRVLFGGPDEVFVLWQEIVFSGGSHGGEIFFAHSRDGGRTFAPPTNLSNSQAGDGKGRLTAKNWDNGSLDLVRAPDGVLMAAWTEYQGSLWFSRSHDAGQTFSPPLRVTGDETRPARGPSLAAAADGQVALAWAVGENAGADIHFATSRDGGQSFGQPTVADKTAAHSDAPRVAMDARGTLHLVYDESTAGPFGASFVRYARLNRQSRSFEPARTISGASDGGAGASFPSLSVDRSGRVYVLWEHHARAGEPAAGLALVVSTDGGSNFSPPVVVPGTHDASLGTNGSRQGKLMRKLAVADDGTVVVVSSHFRENERSRIRLIRGQLKLQ